MGTLRRCAGRRIPDNPQFPDIGRKHIAGNEVIWTHQVQQHVMVYTFDEHVVDVLRIVHHRRSVSQIIQLLGE